MGELLGERLTRIRQRLKDADDKWTQNYVARKLEINPTQLSKWELGVYTPSIESLCQLADLYEVSLDEMCGRSKK